MDVVGKTAILPPGKGGLAAVIRHRVARTGRRLRDAPVLSGSPLVLMIVAFGTLFFVGIFTLILTVSLVLYGNGYVLPRLIAALAILLYVAATVRLIRRGRPRTATTMLLAFYATLGTVILLLWGINVPAGVLILCFVILLSGILLGAQVILPVTMAMTGLLVAVQIANQTGAVHPDTASLALPSTYLDVGDYGAIFIIFGIVSWLAGRRTEQSLARALRAEADLQAEKDLLATRLEERERTLRDAQLEEMRQLYRFAELGQLGTVVLHDLANNLTALTLDIDDIEKQHRRSAAVNRARESIGYLDGMVAAARRQLQYSDRPEVFDVLVSVRETVDTLRAKATRAQVGVTIRCDTDRPFLVSGDPLRLTQVVTILVTNAVEAYAGTAVDGPTVDVRLRRRRSSLEIAVTDHGPGFSIQGRAQLFQPFRSTKPNGMGIGLFISREIVERHFKGTIVLDASRRSTRFVVRIPEYHES